MSIRTAIVYFKLTSDSHGMQSTAYWGPIKQRSPSLVAESHPNTSLSVPRTMEMGIYKSIRLEYQSDDKVEVLDATHW